MSRAKARRFHMWRTIKILVIVIMVALAGCAKWALEQVRPYASEDVLAAARAGDARAAFVAYQQATINAERRKWICIAANMDLPEAQAEIAQLHWHSFWDDPPSPFGHDKYKAYIWTIIAIHRREPVEEMERQLGWVIPEGERWRAMLLAVSWRPDPSQCENMEYSEYFSTVPVAGDSPTPEEVLAAAQAGDAKAALLAYRQATTDAESRKWICMAANRGLPEAQVEIARLHSRSPGDPPGPFAHDLNKAYIWSIIAVRGRLPLGEAERQLGWMVTEDKWRATALAVSWRPDPSQCENIEDSEYFSIASVTGVEKSF